jgi:hypothetical protein
VERERLTILEIDLDDLESIVLPDVLETGDVSIKCHRRIGVGADRAGVVRGRLGGGSGRARRRRQRLPSLGRTPAQRRHDALVELARRAVTAPADGKRPAPLMSVFVGYETFKGRICQLAEGTVVTPGTVASLLDEALIERVVFDGPSRVIDLGRARRFSGAVRRALEALDRGCGHPSGCDAAVERCQGDHVHPWSALGTTTPDNGHLRCGYHNRWRWQHPDPDPPPTPQRPPLDSNRRRRVAWLEDWRADLKAKALQEPDW